MPEMKDLQAHLSLQKPTRVAVSVRGNSKYRDELDPAIIEHTLSILNIAGTKTLYLAREDWGRSVQLVFDVFHDSYDFNNAHNAQDITVVIVSLGGRTEKHFLASNLQEEEINKTMAKLHNLNGWEVRPPYFATHALGAVPEYDKPRDAGRLSN